MHCKFSLLKRIGIVGFLIGFLVSCTSKPKSGIVEGDLKTATLAVALNSISSNSAYLTVVYPTDTPVTQIQVFDVHSKPIGPNQFDYKTKSYDLGEQNLGSKKVEFTLGRLNLKGLKGKTEYRIRFFTGPNDFDERTFSTFTPKRDLKFVIGSCVNSRFKNDAPEIWSAIESEKPDFILMIGDNFYFNPIFGNRRFDDQWLLSFLETRMNSEIFFTKKLIPILTIWDDHELGVSDGGKFSPSFTEAQKFTQIFFPRAKNEFQNRWKSTLGHDLNISGQRFVFLDNRSERTPNGKKEEPASHFGEYQLNKLKDVLNSNDSFVWVISGGEFFGGYHKFESLEGSHPKEFASFTEILKSSKAPFALVGGDRHLSTISRLKIEDVGIETFELISSPLQAKTYPGTLKEFKNPRMIEGVDGVNNFTVVTSNYTNGILTAEIVVKDQKRRVLFETSEKVQKKKD